MFDGRNHAVYELQVGPLRPDVSKPERDRLIHELVRTARELGDASSTFRSPAWRWTAREARPPRRPRPGHTQGPRPRSRGRALRGGL
ncbi:hypothetical protein GCM10023094_33520 [Rhodococcus olei]|uniref:Uncharacterized protein n=1 Tax=Rhodococcus olei TaxID=2161675 RepID=A0ABP8P9B9_9NOCA